MKSVDSPIEPLVLSLPSQKHSPSVLFVGGMPRSGTTLLSDLLALNTEVGLFVEYQFDHFLWHLRPIFGYEEMVHEGAQGWNPGVDARTATGVAVASPEPQSNYPLKINTAASTLPKHPTGLRLPQIALSIFTASLEKPNLRVIGCKYPLFYRDYRESFVSEHFPDIKYIFVVRNPFRQINSSLNRRNLSNVDQDVWHINEVSQAVAECREALSNMVSFSLRYPSQTLIIKYEDLVSRTDAELERIRDFLNVTSLSDHAQMTSGDDSPVVITADEQDAVHEAFGELIDAWSSLDVRDPATLRGELLAKALVPVQAGAVSYQGTSERKYLGAGWSSIEHDGVWTSADDADLLLVGEGRWMIGLTFSAYLPLPTQVLQVEITFNGRSAGKLLLCRGPAVQLKGSSPDVEVVSFDGRDETVWLGPLSLEQTEVGVLSLNIHGAVCPMKEKLSGDIRLLGLKLKTVQFVRPLGTF